MHWYAKRALSGVDEWLHRDVSLSNVEITDSLSSPPSLRATITPEMARLRGDDGRPLFDEWSTLLFGEESGQIRWGGILVRSELVGPDWRIEGAGFSAYAHGIPYIGRFRRIEIDPMDAVDEIWSHIQSQPDGGLGLEVLTPTTPVTLGEQFFYTADFTKNSRDDQRRWDRLTNEVLSNPPRNKDVLETVANQALRHINDGGTINEDFSWNGMGDFAARFNDFLAELFYARGNTFSQNNAEGFLRNVPGLVRFHEADPYELLWWENPDCGAEFDRLAREVPFDYRESHTWEDEDHTVVANQLIIGYPRLGRRKHNLRFVEGENVAEVVAVNRDGDEFANEAIGLGAGEGRRMLRVRIPERDGRLRRPIVYEDKSVRRTGRLRSLTRDALRAYRDLREITRCVVWDHPNAPFGAFDVGDDILVEARAGWADAAIWCRITSWTYRPDGDGRVELGLARSDRYAYGAA